MRSVCGACSNICLIVIMGVFLVNYMLIMILRRDTIINSSVHVDALSLDDTFSLKEKGLTIAIGAFKFGQPNIDFTQTFQPRVFVYEYSSTKESYDELELTTCTESDFSQFWPITNG